MREAPHCSAELWKRSGPGRLAEVLGAAAVGRDVAELERPGGPGLPVEFRIAGFRPEPWRPVDCLNRMAAFSMTGNAGAELQHAQVTALLGAGVADQLFDFEPFTGAIRT